MAVAMQSCRRFVFTALCDGPSRQRPRDVLRCLPITGSEGLRRQRRNAPKISPEGPNSEWT